MKTKKLKLTKQISIKEIDFMNQSIYCGLDVHKKNWAVTIVVNGIIVEKYSMDPDPEQLVGHLKRNYPNGTYYCVYEAGFSGFWAHRILVEHGVHSIITNPADVPTKHKERRRRDDAVDSKKLARELSNGALEGIYIPTEEQEALRSLVRLRKQLTVDQSRTKNRIKSLLNFIGVENPENEEIKHWSGKYIKYLETIEFRQIETKYTMNGLLEMLRVQRKLLTEIIRQLRKFVREKEHSKNLINRLLSIPGIGFVTAITLYTEIMDISRFSKFDKLCSILGLVPDTDSTGENEKITGLTRRHNRYLRNMLIESAWTAIRKDKALMAMYGKLLQRMSAQRAIIRIAKKLVIRIMYVWKNDRDLVYEKVA